MRIKVTGFIESEDLPFNYSDPTHEMGLSNEGYEQMHGSIVARTPDGELIGVSDVEFEKEDD